MILCGNSFSMKSIVLIILKKSSNWNFSENAFTPRILCKYSKSPVPKNFSCSVFSKKLKSIYNTGMFPLRDFPEKNSKSTVPGCLHTVYTVDFFVTDISNSPVLAFLLLYKNFFVKFEVSGTGIFFLKK